MPTSEEIRGLFHKPDQLAQQYVAFIESIRKGGNVDWGVTSIDSRVVPMRPGEVAGIIGRPGHGKSSVAAYLAKHNANKIIAEGQQKEECVCFVTYEQSVEELEAFFQAGEDYSLEDLAWGKIEMDEIIKRALERPKLPIWTIGSSIIKRHKHIRMTIDNVYSALRQMETEFKIHPRLICMDYIQIIPVERARQRVEEVTEAVVQSKELAREIGAAMILTSQAARRVDDYDEQLPNANDSQWTSAFEQVIDKGFSIWRPAKTHRDVKEIELQGQKFPVTEQLIVIENWKQRLAPSAGRFILNFHPGLVRLAEMERETPKQYEGEPNWESGTYGS